MIPDFAPSVVLPALAAALVRALVRVLREYEQAVVFALGFFSGVRDPGPVPLAKQTCEVEAERNRRSRAIDAEGEL